MAVGVRVPCRALSDTEVVTLGVRDKEAVGVEVWDGDGVRLGVTLREGTLAVALGDGEAVGDTEGDNDTDGDTEEVEEADLDGLGVFVDDLLLVNVADGDLEAVMVDDGDGETLREGTLAVAEGEGEGAALREDVGDGSAVSLTVPVTDAEKETLCDREDEMDCEGWDMVGELEKDVDLVALGDTDGVRDTVEVRVGVRDVEGDRDVDREAEGDKDCVTVTEDDSDMLGVKVGVTEMDLVTEMVLVLEMEEASLTRPANVVSTVCRPSAVDATTRKVSKLLVGRSLADTVNW